MAKPFDAVLKQLLDAYAPAWVGWLAPRLGLPAGPVEPIDADLSTVQPAADKVFRLRTPDGGSAGLLHLEAQSSWDGDLPRRMLVYNVLLDDRHGEPVQSLVLLLRREADSPALTGVLTRARFAGREYLRFGYEVVRVWELPADGLLAAGPWAGPIALLTDDAQPRLPALVQWFAAQVEAEVPADGDRALLLSSALILLGLRYDREDAARLFQGVQKMRESSTYQMILDEGEVRGQQNAVLALLADRFTAVPPDVEARVKGTTDLDRLRAALLAVYRIASPADLPL